MQAWNLLKFRKNRKDAPLRPFTLTIYSFFSVMPANVTQNNNAILQIISFNYIINTLKMN